ncbi:MAG: molybdopterin synthase sulfur carrier subunit [SAR324 cluster bacterium]|uniref:Molybdopterin synthase sulfur carrier subunit n=1 Tax=SAR324 cluster bacterium TaxID=2024889 RepID=A0A2A4TAM0_9DELT|nr:MAG: molybdopterin synthase sulfur carrier subunit [SAR324 cluster bacterium]
MNVRVLLFAHLKEIAGESEISLELDAEATGATLLKKLTELYPAADAQKGYLRLSMDGEYLSEDGTIVPDSEIAVFPPVSGG